MTPNADIVDQEPAAWRSWFRSLWLSRPLRVALLVPSALTMLTGIDDAGRLASWVVGHWRPVHDAFSRLLVGILHVPPVVAGLLLPVFLFSPFVVSGVIDLRRGRGVVHPAVGLAALNLAPYVISLGAFGHPPWNAVAGTYYILTASLLGIIISGFPGLSPYPGYRTLVVWAGVTALGSILLAGVAVFYFSPTVSGFGAAIWIILLFVVLTLPLLNPRRLTDLGILVAALWAAAILYEAASRALEMVLRQLT